jgi:CAAX prenyl protease-like protein
MPAASPLPFVSRAAFVRCAPFAVFMALLALRGVVPEDGSWGIDPRWLYGVKVLVVGAMLWWWRREYTELRWAAAERPTAMQLALAVAVGFAVFAMWIRLDAPWMTVGVGAVGFTPIGAEGRIDWALVVVRCMGAVLLVPVMEELFWRSFLMRWVQQQDFLALAPARAGLRAVLISAAVFALAHPLWLAALLTGVIYAWLYGKTERLWVPTIAHAVTNAALAAHVLATEQWQFW